MGRLEKDFSQPGSGANSICAGAQFVRHDGVYTVDFGFGPGLAAKSVKREGRECVCVSWINQISLERIDRFYFWSLFVPLAAL